MAPLIFPTRLVIAAFCSVYLNNRSLSVICNRKLTNLLKNYFNQIFFPLDYTANFFSTTWLYCRVAVNVTLTSRCWKPFWTYQYGHRNNVTTPAPYQDSRCNVTVWETRWQCKLKSTLVSRSSCLNITVEQRHFTVTLPKVTIRTQFYPLNKILGEHVLRKRGVWKN